MAGPMLAASRTSKARTATARKNASSRRRPDRIPPPCPKEPPMSSKGNRSNPNHVRTSGHPDAPDETGARSGGASGTTHQESRDHNKHNNDGQSGHKPQRHSPAEGKH